jgi:hypothetical protein
VIVLVCGGRKYGNVEHEQVDLFACLDEVHAKTPITLLVHGAARGADLLAETWAKGHEVPYLGLPAKWTVLPRHEAGPARNLDMLDTRRAGFPFRVPIDLVVAFPGGSGTNHMKVSACAADLRVWEPFGQEETK